MPVKRYAPRAAHERRPPPVTNISDHELDELRRESGQYISTRFGMIAYMNIDDVFQRAT